MAQVGLQSSLWKLFYTTLMLASHVIADNNTQPISVYESRPDLAAPALTVSINNAGRVSPGYIFLAPFESTQPGPYIYDSGGNLVWNGFGASGPGNVHDFHVCTYQGSDHLCFFQGNQENGYGRGQGAIMDNTYTVVNTVRTGNGATSADMHEFDLIGGGASALMTMYMPVHHDLSANGITSGQGWIMDGCFQEVDTATKNIIFDWRSLGHVDPSLSFVNPNTTDTSGDGLTKDTAWDYFHINSVDKNAEGDYLVSARHTSTVYKISGADGHIIWQLGGKQSTFAQTNFNFSFQHDARFVSVNSTTTVISLFDNASNGFTNTASCSSGMLIAIDNSTNQATLLQSFVAPNGGFLSASQGNFQQLANGNSFFGWGSIATISEHAADGSPVLLATFATTTTMNYRAYKFNWTATPVGKPAVYSYAHNNNTAPTVYYASWNGATEVASWRFYSSSSPSGPFTLIGNQPKLGFETMFTVSGYQAFSIVEAVGANGSGLANSSTIGTFVPGAGLAGACTDTQCPMAKGYAPKRRRRQAS